MLKAYLFEEVTQFCKEISTRKGPLPNDPKILIWKARVEWYKGDETQAKETFKIVSRNHVDFFKSEGKFAYQRLRDAYTRKTEAADLYK